MNYGPILGGMLVPGGKHNITEVRLNPYRYMSVLRMTSLEAHDFDEYQCVSKNTVGMSEEIIKIFGKFLL